MSTLLVFIDESGDPGFEVERLSTILAAPGSLLLKTAGMNNPRQIRYAKSCVLLDLLFCFAIEPVANLLNGRHIAIKSFLN